MKKISFEIKSFFNKYEHLIILGLLLFGLVLRIGLILNVDEPVDRDALEYYSIANNIVNQHSFSIDGENPTARRSPGYPVFLAISMIVVGQNPNHLYIIQAIINILTVLIVYLSLNKLTVNPLIRRIITILFLFSTTFVYVNVFYAVVITMFVMAILLYLSIETTHITNDTIRSALLGFLIGILILLRPTFLYLPVFIIIISCGIALFINKIKIREPIIITLVAICVIFPWSIRNRVVFQQWIPLVNAGGGELWQANLEIENRTVWYSVTDIAKYEQQRTESAELQAKLRSEYIQKYNLNSVIELNKFLKQKAVEIILKHPIRYSILCINRFLIFWFSPPIGSTTLKSISPILFWLVLLIKYILTLLSIIGLYSLARNNWQKYQIIILTVIYLTLIHSAVHAIQRYFLPLIPIVYFGLGYYLNIKLVIKRKGCQAILRKTRQFLPC